MILKITKAFGEEFPTPVQQYLDSDPEFWILKIESDPEFPIPKTPRVQKNLDLWPSVFQNICTFLILKLPCPWKSCFGTLVFGNLRKIMQWTIAFDR